MKDLLNFLQNQLFDQIEEELCASADKKRTMLTLTCRKCCNDNTLLMGFSENDHCYRACTWCDQLLINRQGLPTSASHDPLSTHNIPLPSLTDTEAIKYQRNKLGRGSC